VYRDEDLDADLHREADQLGQMSGSPGWAALARWIQERIEIDAAAIERGVTSWDDYQRAVGRLDAYRKVIGRPDEVVAASRDLITGDSE
jgi:hypothetical protein